MADQDSTVSLLPLHNLLRIGPLSCSPDSKTMQTTQLELSSHSEAAVACTSAQCLAMLMEMFPQDAAAGILSGDGLLLLADALQPSEGNPADMEASAASATQDTDDSMTGQNAMDADCMRQQQLLTCLAAACQFQPLVNIMAGAAPLPQCGDVAQV